jgi:HAD superfamily hydrolase (TIGR01484 family)
MKPLREMLGEQARHIELLSFDVDDTLLSHGQLCDEAREALVSGQAAGVTLVANTGRSYAFGERLLEMLPMIDACLVENGALALVRDQNSKQALHTESLFYADDTRDGALARDTRLDALASAVHAALPNVVLARDAQERKTDITWDVGEFAHVPSAECTKIHELCRSKGARTSQSSIHLHATFLASDKASGLLRFCCKRFGWEPTRARARIAFVGDSGNDASAFFAFPLSIGVANVRAHMGALSMPPAFVADKAMGEGFAEAVQCLLGKRKAHEESPCKTHGLSRCRC